MTNAEETTIISANKAHENYEKTVRARANIEGNFIVLGILLQENQRDGLYKFLGYESFSEYLGAPELGFKKSTAYKLISLISLYIDKLNIPVNRLIGIGSTKLNTVSRFVESDVEGWLDKAEHLSKSSLSEEIAGVSGKEVSISPPSSLSPVSGRGTPAPLASPRMTPSEYEALVASSPCLNCGATEGVVKAHFPRTRVRAEKPWHIVPLCGKCHAEQEGSSEWCWNYRGNWAKWFYSLIAGD